jgi:putative membrane protein
MWNDDGHGVRMHDAYGAGWTLMLILVVLLAIAVAVLVAVVLRPTHPAPPVTTIPPGRPPESEAQQILRRRFASGEIDEEEFRGRRAALADDEPWR